MVNELQEKVEALRRCELPVKVAVGFVRFLEAVEFRDRLLHWFQSTMRLHGKEG
ncbi:MAG: hypothetical protein ABIU29_08130 [Chthoniobacterales bacterium]